MLLKNVVLCLYTFGLSALAIYLFLNDFFEWLLYVLSLDTQVNPVYDYIIVGAGSAGSVVALRLAEMKNASVLLLEAGGYGSSLLNVPMVAPALQLSLADWGYKTVPQKNACLGLENQESRWPMGRIMGGSFRLNNLLYVRGHPDDYKNWYADDPDFNYDYDILQYFKKSENQRGQYINDEKFHSENGPLLASKLPFTTTFGSALLQAAESLGFRVGDVNGKYNSGFTQPQVSTKSGARHTTNDHLLHQSPPNLHILTNSLATEILFKSGYEAYAIKYQRYKRDFRVTARKAIVLSAGVVGTPKILMLSGVGPETHLKTLKIPLKVHLPVGDNLRDHLTSGLDLILLNRSLEINLEKSVSPRAVFEYVFDGKGPLAFPGCEVIGLANTEENPSRLRNPRPNLQLMLIPMGISIDAGIHFAKAMGISRKSSAYFNRLLNESAVTILPVLLHPKSVGSVRLRDGNALSSPLIDPQYLSDPSDIEVLLEGIKLIKKLIGTDALKRFGARLNPEKFPGCETHKFDTEEYWECYLRHLTLSGYHPVGTCKMGAVGDSSAVVDFDFRVRGTNKLFVADASVFPTLTSGNVNAAVVLVAEKAAAAVKKWGYWMEGCCTLSEVFVRRLSCDLVC